MEPMNIDTGAPGGDSIANGVAAAVTAANDWADANEQLINHVNVSAPGGGGDEYAPLT